MEVATSSTIGTLVFLLWGLIVWGLQFSASYIGHTWLCAIGAPPLASNLLVGGLAAIAVVLLLPAVFASQRLATLAGIKGDDRDRVGLHTISRAIAALSTVAALWTTAGGLLLQACVQGR